jgi:uncharacterized repeat protein (TIGR03803 family)
MHPPRFILAQATGGVLALAASSLCTHAAIVTFEAESGALGSDWAVSNSSSPAYITTLSNGAGNNPASSNRVATYSVVFPEAGTYQLYARVRVGPDPFNDDSMFYANSFGTRSPTNNSGWSLVNGLGSAGFTNSADVVTGAGNLGGGVWKWINLSLFAGAGNVSFTVNTGGLTQTFQIGARENGLDMDKFAFGTQGLSYAVSNLDAGTDPTNPAPLILTNTFIGPNGMALHRFNPLTSDLNLDGANPVAGLTLSGGLLYGTTLNGGLQGAGTTFYVSLDGTNFNAFHSFTNPPDAANPEADLVASGSGFLGTSAGGGSNGTGAVFAVQTNGNLALFCSFSGVNADTATNVGGASPGARVVQAGGTVSLFGAAAAGGLYANGTLFSVATNSGAVSVLHDFTLLDSVTGTNVDGATPCGLVLSSGTLFGTTSAGGPGGSGTVFSVLPNGNSFTTIHSFTAMDPLTGTNSDGAIPMAGLIFFNGTLYGTTSAGGSGGNGTVFSIGPSGGGFNILHQFSAVDALAGTNSDGAKPMSALIISNNTLYGATPAGGAGGSGTVFSVNTSSQFKTIYSFTPITSAAGTNADGAFPVGDLLLLGNALYGTTSGGGPGSSGTVFTVPLPLPPALITEIIRNADSSVTLDFAGSPNSTNYIQTATNLAPLPAWRDVSTNIADGGGLWQLTDTNTRSAPVKFYRSYTR